MKLKNYKVKMILLNEKELIHTDYIKLSFREEEL